MKPNVEIWSKLLPKSVGGQLHPTPLPPFTYDPDLGPRYKKCIIGFGIWKDSHLQTSKLANVKQTPMEGYGVIVKNT